MESLAVERSIWIAAHPERVWDAITQAEQIMHWWGGDHWGIEALEPGAVIQFGDPNDLMTATIQVVDPPREFVIHWPPQPQYHSTNFYTRWVLAEENGGTRVTVTESGFEGLPAAVRQERYDLTAQGYETVLVGLKAYLER